MVGFARRPGQTHRIAELGFRFHRIIAQEVDRLAHLGDSVRQGLAGFPRHQRHQPVGVRFKRVSHVAQDPGARRSALGVPVLLGVMSDLVRRLHVLFGGLVKG